MFGKDDVIARELCANLLIHREYFNPYPAKLIITKEGIYTENANKPRMIGFIDLNNYIYPLLNLEVKQMDSKVRTVLTYLKNKKIIDNIGSDAKPNWIVI